jgi:hypothetical protein
LLDKAADLATFLEGKVCREPGLEKLGMFQYQGLGRLIEARLTLTRKEAAKLMNTLCASGPWRKNFTKAER